MENLTEYKIVITTTLTCDPNTGRLSIVLNGSGEATEVMKELADSMSQGFEKVIDEVAEMAVKKHGMRVGESEN